MRDIDIRNKLLKELIRTEARDSLIVEEFGLCRGTVRIDLVVVNGSFNGYEIKSEKDTLMRLPNQQEIYSKIFDTVTIVAGSNHLGEVGVQIPDWWGIWLARDEKEEIEFEIVRTPKKNPNIDAISLAQCLWRDEVMKILKDIDLHRGLLSKPRMVLWQKLAESVSVEKLGEHVRQHLKGRDNWRSAAPPMLSGD